MPVETLSIYAYGVAPSLRSNNDLKHVFHYVDREDRLAWMLSSDAMPRKMLACDQQSLLDVSRIIAKYSFQKLFILTNGSEILNPLELSDGSVKMVELDEESHLILHLLGEAIVYYDGNASRYTAEENRPLAFDCSSIALRLWHFLRQLEH